MEPEVEANWALVARENESDPALQEGQDAEMPVVAPVESVSTKRGSDAVAENEERARLRLRAEGKRGQKYDMQDVLEPQAKTRARPAPRRIQKPENTQAPRSGGRGYVDSSYREWFSSNSGRLDLEC